MPDISMCLLKECPRFKDCYRAQAKPDGKDGMWQTYIDWADWQKKIILEQGTCDLYWKCHRSNITMSAKEREKVASVLYRHNNDGYRMTDVCL